MIDDTNFVVILNSVVLLHFVRLPCTLIKNVVNMNFVFVSFIVWGIKREHTLANTSFVYEMTCMLQHPFTAVVAGPTGCGKSQFVLRLIDNVREMTEPPPTRIWYSY